MGLRYRKSKKVAPGIRLYIGKTGISTSFGKRGASISVGKRGTFLNIGIPGTGLSYRQRIDSRDSNTSTKSKKTDTEVVMNPSDTQYKTYNIHYWSIFKYIIGLLAIYLVYNWTKIFSNSHDWLNKFTIFYLIAIIVIILVFFKPVKAIIKSVFSTNRMVYTQEMGKGKVKEATEESSKKILSEIIQNVKNNDSENSQITDNS
ncbi:MAG: DUF4236 domain-containing protein [Muribaculaceae bacterium]|nr:DUF4236 domain-containing protein [Muribaculaceae bacterium]